MIKLKASTAILLTLTMLLPVILCGYAPKAPIGMAAVSTVKSGINAVKDVTVGNTAKNGAAVTIPKSAFDRNEALTLEPIALASNPKMKSADFSILGAPVSVKVEGKASVRLNQPAVISIVIPKSQLTSIKRIDDVYAAYFNGSKWEYFLPSSINLKTGIAKFTTYHFSPFGVGKLSEKEQIARFTDQMAVQTWAKSINEKNFLEATRSYFNEAFEKMGIKDTEAKGKLLRGIVKENDFGALLVSIESNNMTDFQTKLGEMTGKAILKRYLLDGDFMSGAVNTVSTASKAAAFLSKGQYEDAQKEIASGMLDFFPYGRALKLSVEVIDTAVNNWKDSEIEYAFQCYKSGAKGVHGYNAKPGDFDLLQIQMRGALNRIHTDAIKNYCEAKGVKESSLGAKMLEQIKSDAVKKLKLQFDRRLKSEGEIEKQKAAHNKIITAFKKNLLLERGTFNFGFSDNIEDRLNRLYIVKENIQEMIGREIPVEDMCKLIAEWYSDKSKNRETFYKILKGYMKAKGITSAPAKIQPSGNTTPRVQPAGTVGATTSNQAEKKEYAWVLKKVIDRDAKDVMAIANKKNPLVYKYDVSYSPGNVKTIMTYVGATDKSMKINGEYPTNGANIAIQASWSSPPQVIRKDATITLDLSVSMAGRSHKWPSANGTVSAQVVTVKSDGESIGTELMKFSNKDKNDRFETSTANNYQSFKETVTAKIGGGSTAGQKIAVSATGGMNGMMTGTTYIYEWALSN